jgi:transposase
MRLPAFTPAAKRATGRLAQRARPFKLVRSGMSQRQAAKVLGVDESTVRADLRDNPAENAEESRTPATRTRQANEKKRKAAAREGGEANSSAGTSASFCQREDWSYEILLSEILARDEDFSGRPTLAVSCNSFPAYTALNFMRVYEMDKSRTVRDLNLSMRGLYLLAAPSTPDEARVPCLI